MKLIKGCNDKATVIIDNEVKTLFSYETEIASYIYGKIIYKDPEAIYTQTTKRHIKWFEEICETL